MACPHTETASGAAPIASRCLHLTAGSEVAAPELQLAPMWTGHIPTFRDPEPCTMHLEHVRASTRWLRNDKL